MIILLLLKQNYYLKKQIKKINADHKNALRTMHVNNELYEVNQNLKNELNVCYYNLNNYKQELERQRKINVDIVLKYNSIRESVIDVPLKHGRFFAVKLAKEKVLLHFSEN